MPLGRQQGTIDIVSSSKLPKILFTCALLLFAVIGIPGLLITGGAIKMYRMNTPTMAPTLAVGQLVFGRPYRRGRMRLERFQLIAFRPPSSPNAMWPSNPSVVWVRRILGLPGEHIEIQDDKVLINGVPLSDEQLPAALRKQKWLTLRDPAAKLQRDVRLGPDDVFVIGDDLESAIDSRTFGPLSPGAIESIVRCAGPRIGPRTRGPKPGPSSVATNDPWARYH